MLLSFVTKCAGKVPRKPVRQAVRRSTLCAALAPALFAAASLAAEAASAVSLGSLTVQSRPGEPLNAVLEINDVDLTVSPLLVRVAPPATYLRQGVSWPEQAQDLRITRDGANSGVRVRVVGEESFQGGFPLLIELNAGGVVTVREYAIEPQDGRYVVTASAEHTTVSAEAVQAAKEAAARREAAAAGKPAVPMAPAPRFSEAEPASARALASPASAEADGSSKPAAAPQRRGRFAPNVVKEYVALNGFDAEKPFVVQRDMTLWSIAKLYWPSYPGATLEQLALALTDRNPNAFVDGSPAHIVVGEKLEAPSSTLVFSTDALSSFRTMHGEKTAVPLPTQNLIDAQAVSRECAEAVANAQNAVKSGGASVEAVGEAGRKALADWKAKAAEEAAPASGGAPAASASAADAAPAPSAAAADAASSVEPASPAEPVEPSAAETSAPTPAPAPASDAEPSAASAGGTAAPSGAEGGFLNGRLGMAAVVVLCLIALLAWLRRSRKSRDEDKSSGKTPASGRVAFQKTVAPSTAAQLQAVDAAVSEAVKNGTTAGAMGAGTAAYVRAQMAEDKKAASAEKAVDKSEAQAQDSGAPAAAESAAAPADQPWLSPDDDELPPLDPEEAAQKSGPQGLQSAEEILKSVDLSLEADDSAKAALAAEAGLAAAAAPGKPGAEHVPPLESVSIEGEAAPAAQPQAAEAAPAPAEPPKSLQAQKEEAQNQALEAKLKLAGSFIGLGAVKEARELLLEVRRQGTPEQRERALALESKLESAS